MAWASNSRGCSDCTSTLLAARVAGPGHRRRRLHRRRVKLTAPAPMGAAALDGTLWPVAIGVAARLSNVSAKMVRHYESLGLLAAVARTDSGYRQYNAADVRTLQFIKRGRDLGFSMVEIAELVGLWHNRKRASASVKRLSLIHI